MHGAISAPLPVLNEMKRQVMVELAMLLVTALRSRALGPNDYRTRNICMTTPRVRCSTCHRERALLHAENFQFPQVMTSSINPELSNSRFHEC